MKSADRKAPFHVVFFSTLLRHPSKADIFSQNPTPVRPRHLFFPQCEKQSLIRSILCGSCKACLQLNNCKKCQKR